MASAIWRTGAGDSGEVSSAMAASVGQPADRSGPGPGWGPLAGSDTSYPST
jgi:hypothetical protein